MTKLWETEKNNYLKCNSIVCERITLDNILAITEKKLSKIGWYRVACLDTDVGSGAIGGSFIADLHTWYNFQTNMSFIFTINVAHRNVKLTKLSSAINAKIVDKVRVVRNTELKKMYLDIHYNVAVENTVFLNILQFTRYFDKQQYQSVSETSSNEEVLATLNID